MSPTLKLSGEVTLPGDKSISHRALLIGALASGRSRFEGLSNAADPASTADCLRALGVEVEFSESLAVIHGHGRLGLRAPSGPLDCGNSGTTMRLLSGILAGQSFDSELVGDASLSRRPMERVASPLRQMGATVQLADHGTAPVRILGRSPLQAISYRAQIPSAQVKSALLLAGVYAEGTTEVVETIPTRDHTERMLGLDVVETGEGRTVRVEGGRHITPLDMQIPGDVSAAVFLIAATALLPGSEVVLKGVGTNPGRTRVLTLLRSWGVSIVEQDPRTSGGEPLADLVVRGGRGTADLHIVPEDVSHCIDEIPALACLAMAAGVGCSIRGAGELRSKETDRIAQLVKNFRALGLVVDESDDGFAFEARTELLPATIVTGGDHRIAMAFAVAGLAHPGIVVDDPECVAVSFPEFFNTLERLRKR